ncbi:chemotaxis protein CheA [Mucisphaera calidilacus]|uniref:histidine kinase n=1 Tax=Mucisphaera calidilacus TaxID=2527982 RepID=A0A518C0J7_9BACT|nr:chemotaxis protein CheA [Mucisphaera calidilacus]QDU72748.1 Chemotaxis protein CheA [Mucisphaera calidilacus]
MDAIDPSLLQDFLTESGELIDQLDNDLVKLETADDADQKDLLNSCFRALHTIKGAASFLNLETIIRFAHVAEEALNRMRKGEIEVTDASMDVLLQSADVVRQMISDLGEGREADPAPEPLMEALGELVKAQTAAAAVISNDTPEPTTPADDNRVASRALELPEQKADLLEFMVTDLREQVELIEEAAGQFANDATRSDATEHLAEVADILVKTADFFDLDDLSQLTQAIHRHALDFRHTDANAIPDLVIRIRALAWLVKQSADTLAEKRALNLSVNTYIQRLDTLAQGNTLEPDVANKHNDDLRTLILLDELLTEAEHNELTGNAAAPDTPGNTQTPDAQAAADKTDDKTETKAATKQVAEQTIRVEVGRLESLLNLVGQLVLNKNRLLGLTRTIRDSGVPHETAESFSSASGELDQLMGELQMGVMRTRMQPLAKLFDRYPRVIRDMARMTGKKLRLEIEGKDTEVDKSVLEQLSDPLVHILRNSADHGIEAPDKRQASDKPEEGCIRLVAEHQGSHVRIAIIDDGKGLSRDVIARKAVERGLTTEEQLTGLSDEDVFRFILQAGFSTAEKVSDLSGRGVGMDVVRTNVEKINGTININSVEGDGTTIEILIPLTVAIMPAMVTGVGKHLYAIPLQSIHEIVRPDEHGRHTVNGQDVIRLRDTVLPLIDLTTRLNEDRSENSGRFAVVVSVGSQRAGLLVDRLVGQQEIVIKPLDDGYTQGGPFSGATIQEDGEVSLILDVTQILRNQNPTAERQAA